MVAPSDRAGAVVTCPNCKRALRIPSGKGRGVELAPAPAATKTRTSRRCTRCNQEIPVDSQICPHCRTILMDSPAQPGRSAPAIAFGGSRTTWWNRLPAGGKVGILVGGFVFLGILALVIYHLGSSWDAAQLTRARQNTQRALTQGKQLETVGKFVDAYELYTPSEPLRRLRQSTLREDNDLARALESRTAALHYLVPEPKVSGSIYWKPESQQAGDEVMVQLRETYPSYRQRILAVVDAGTAAVQTARSTDRQQAFDEKVALVMEAYVQLIGQTTPPQRAQFTFQTLLEAIRELTAANRNWTEKSARSTYLNNAEGYLNVLKERVSQPGYPDTLWPR
jgi:hypothetical protein